MLLIKILGYLSIGLGSVLASDHKNLRLKAFRSLIKKDKSVNSTKKNGVRNFLFNVDPEKSEVCNDKFGAMEDLVEFRRMAIYDTQKEVIPVDFNLRERENWDFYYQLVTESKTCKSLCDQLIPKTCPATKNIKNHIYPGCCDVSGCSCYCYYECTTIMDYLTKLEELLPTTYYDKCVTNATSEEVKGWLKKACFSSKKLYQQKKRTCKKESKTTGVSSKVKCRNAGKCVQINSLTCKACIKFACEGEKDVDEFGLISKKPDCHTRKKCRKRKCKRKKTCTQECNEDDECTKVCKTKKICRKKKCKKIKKCS